MKTILMMGCALALLFAAVPQPVMAANSQMNLTVGTTNDAKAGDTVTVRLVGSNNPGLSTFAARLAYDDSDLEYVGTTWANTISSDSGNIELVSPVTENNQQALNLSAILNKTYSQNETIATVTFKAKNAYTTMPVTLTVREVTDASYNPVTVTTVVDASAGQTHNQCEKSDQKMIPRSKIFCSISTAPGIHSYRQEGKPNRNHHTCRYYRCQEPFPVFGTHSYQSLKNTSGDHRTYHPFISKFRIGTDHQQPSKACIFYFPKTGF